MAEAAMAEDLGKTPMSPALQATLLRARDYASGQSHNQVTVEHLLLALSEDEDAGLVLQSSQVDLNRLRNDVADYLGNLSDRGSGGPTQPAVSTALAEILKYATLAARQGRRNRIDGAIVLAALVGDGRSMAASFLNAQGLTFEEAIRVLQRAAAQTGSPAGAPRAVQPEPQPVAAAPAPIRAGSNAEDILAAARERVEQRTLPPRAEVAAPAGARARAVPSAASKKLRDVAVTHPQSPAITLQAPAAAPPPVDENAARAPPNPEQQVPAAAEPPVSVAPAELRAERVEASGPPKLPDQPNPRQPALAELGMTGAPDRSTAQLEPPRQARQPSAAWAPPPLPVPPQPQGSIHQRMPQPGPPPGMAPVRQPMPAPGMPNTSERPLERPQRPEPMAGAPWPDPAPRPSLAPQPTAPTRAPAPSYTYPGPGIGPQRSGGSAIAMPGDAPRLPAIEAGQVSFTLPKRWRRGRTETIEVRVARTPLSGGGAGPVPASLRPELIAARAIMVRLRGAKGAFTIEPASPETQWDQAAGTGGRTAGDAAVWRFSVTPLRGAVRDLHLMVAARTVGADGVMADTVLPDQVLPAKVSRDLLRPLRQVLAVVAIALTSIALWTAMQYTFKLDLVGLVQRLAGL